MTRAEAAKTPPDVFVGHIDPAKFGIPIYPGAKQSTEGGGVATTGSEGNSQVLILTTPDSYDAVVAWYKSRLPMETDGVRLGPLSTSMFRVGAKDASDAKFATVASVNGQTSITFSAKQPAPSTGATASKPSAPGAPTLVDLSAIGLPLYPNVYESGWTGNFSDDKQAARVGQMSTHDTFDQVYSWYKERMPAGSESPEAAASNHTTDEGDRIALFDVGSTADAKMTRVMLARDKADNYTIINLSGHTTK